MSFRIYLVFLVLLSSFAVTVNGQTSSLTYQGRLTDGVVAANGTYQMQFALFDAVSGGTQQGSAITNNAVTVANGVFTVQLDFTSAPFAVGSDRWLQIGVRKATDPPGFTTLTPRQQLTASPYSIRTISAGTSDSLSASCVTCVTNAQINSLDGSKVTGTVANAASATTAGNVTGIVALANGGTGSATKNFVDLSTAQNSIGGDKTFTGNVTVNGLLSATLGQSSTMVVSTGTITITSNTSGVQIPGAIQNITVPANTVVLIAAGGGISTTSNVAAGFSSVDVVVAIDNVIAPGSYRRVLALNNAGVVGVNQHWNMLVTANLIPGPHVISLFAAGTGIGSNAIVAGDNNNVNQASLNVMFLKK